MPYEISDVGASIQIRSDNDLLVIPKSSILGFKYLGDDMIKIERTVTGTDLYFRKRDVSIPVLGEATGLILAINEWL